MFHTMQVRDVVSWTAMIAGYGCHGEARMVVMCFREMVHDRFSPLKEAETLITAMRLEMD